MTMIDDAILKAILKARRVSHSFNREMPHLLSLSCPNVSVLMIYAFSCTSTLYQMIGEITVAYVGRQRHTRKTFQNIGCDFDQLSFFTDFGLVDGFFLEATDSGGQQGSLHVARLTLDCG
jgi:hypothetical protein